MQTLATLVTAKLSYYSTTVAHMEPPKISRYFKMSKTFFAGKYHVKAAAHGRRNYYRFEEAVQENMVKPGAGLHLRQH